MYTAVVAAMLTTGSAHSGYIFHRPDPYYSCAGAWWAGPMCFGPLRQVIPPYCPCLHYYPHPYSFPESQPYYPPSYAAVPRQQPGPQHHPGAGTGRPFAPGPMPSPQMMPPSPGHFPPAHPYPGFPPPGYPGPGYPPPGQFPPFSNPGIYRVPDKPDQLMNGLLIPYYFSFPGPSTGQSRQK